LGFESDWLVLILQFRLYFAGSVIQRLFRTW